MSLSSHSENNCLVCPRIVVYEYVISAVPFVSDRVVSKVNEIVIC